MEGGTAAYVSGQCFNMLRTVAELMISWQPNGSILIGHQLTVVSPRFIKDTKNFFYLPWTSHR